MNIFYDHQAFSFQNYGGVSRIFAELLKDIPEISNNQVHLSVLFSNNAYLKEFGIGTTSFLPSLTFPKKQGLLYRINELYNIYDIKTTKFDIYHPTFYNPSLVKYIKNKPIVATYHDMIHEKFRKEYKVLANDRMILEHKAELIKKASKIIAVSENTKRDLVEIYKVDHQKINVIHLGSSLPVQRYDENKVNNIVNPYILYVGNRAAYKNFIPFINAVADYLIRNDLHVICAGGGDFSKEEHEIFTRLKIGYLVKYQAVNDKKLIDLYSNALVYVFPSLYEGFGIPITEAFSCNCPCIISNTSSLPEVAGDAALYMDPHKLESLIPLLDELINNTQIRKDLILKGQKRLKEFSWEKHVRQTLELYSCL